MTISIDQRFLFLRMTGTNVRQGEWRSYEDINLSQGPIYTDDGYVRQIRGVMEL